MVNDDPIHPNFLNNLHHLVVDLRMKVVVMVFPLNKLLYLLVKMIVHDHHVLLILKSLKMHRILFKKRKEGDRMMQ
jgi:hypothetical protein